MINTIWTNLRPPDGTPPIPLTIGPSQTGILHVAVDLVTVYNRGELAGIELEVKTGVVPPGVAQTITVWYAFSSYDNRTPTQLATAAASFSATLPNTANTISSYSLPITYQGARFLHVWFDSSAMATGSVPVMELRINAKTGD